eukprot:GABW01000382.1.p3 GENE.GABW01000382.1~~GABW01000382.1.p3  ORF type:complete len:54 (-),score=8.42 GABW01000382.1:58-219(-)
MHLDMVYVLQARVGTGKCTCDLNWFGDVCDTHCDPEVACNGHGVCVGPSECSL